MITSTSRSLLGPISPLAAEPKRITRRGWTASTMRLTSSSMACGSGCIIGLLGSIMFDCLVGYYQTTDFGCIWAGLHSHPRGQGCGACFDAHSCPLSPLSLYPL